MSAKELIDLAASIGIGIGRNRAGCYRYAQVVDGQHIENEFHGTWQEFVRFIKNAAERKAVQS